MAGTFLESHTEVEAFSTFDTVFSSAYLMIGFSFYYQLLRCHLPSFANTFF